MTDNTDIFTDNISGNWYTVSDAAAILKVTKRTIWRQIKTNKVKSKLENGIRYIYIDITDKGTDDTDMVSEGMSVTTEIVEQLREQIRDLRQQLQEKDKQIERQEMIMMQLSRDIESQQKLLEYHREPFWWRWFRRKEAE